MYVLCVGESIDTIESCMLAVGEFEYGMPIASPLHGTMRNISTIANVLRSNITNQNIAEVVPDDYEIYQVHYSKKRGITVYDNELKPYQFVDKFNKIFKKSILSACVIVYYSPKNDVVLVSDIFYLHIMDREIDMRLFPLWKRLEYLHKHFTDVPEYCNRFNQLKGKRNFCLIFKQKSDRFLFSVEYERIRRSCIEVSVISGIINRKQGFINKYRLANIFKNDDIFDVNVMDIDEKNREYLLYNLKPRVRVNISNDVDLLHFDGSIKVSGHYIKLSSKILNKKIFKIKRVIHAGV